MTTPLYFPTVADDRPVLCNITLKKGDKPGLYPCGLKKTDDRFWQPLLDVSQRLPIELNARGFDVTQLRFTGLSATGCVSFFEKYDIDSMKDGNEAPYIAISVRDFVDDDSVDSAKPVSDIEKKLNLCRECGMDIFVVPQYNRKDLVGIEEGDIMALNSANTEAIQQRLRSIQAEQSATTKSMLVLLAGRDWEKELANLLGLQERSVSDHFASVPADEEGMAQGKRLYELYLAALAGDWDKERGMLEDVFRGGGRVLGDTGMSRNTFPWMVMYERDAQDKDKTPYRDIVFGNSSLVFSGATSTGKTTLAKALMLHALAQEQRAVYIAPTRSLLYEVYQDFCALLEHMRRRAEELDKNSGDGEYAQLIRDLVTADDSKFVLSTGEKNENDGQVLRGDYRILFAVYEKANLFMNMLPSQDEGRKPDLIIIDELHMLCDNARGGVLDLFMGKILSMCGQDRGAIRIIGITTEDQGAGDVKDFLAALGGRASVLSIPQRPIPVSHYVWAGGRTSLITRLHGTTHSLDPWELKRIKRELETDKEAKFDPKDMLHSKDPDSGTSHKKVIGVFNSIKEIYSVCKNLSEERLANAKLGEKFCDQKVVESLKKALDDSFINEDEKNILLKGIETGIFVYYSPLDYVLREEMARAFQKDSEKTQILLTTEALAYGVNFPADAIYLTYLKESDSLTQGRGGGYIERNLFFNILGRAGRLGKSARDSSCCAFIVLNGKSTPLEADIKHVFQMYGVGSSFQVKTIDRDTEKNILERDIVKFLDDISFITFRTTLDALRFVSSGKEIGRATVREVRSFLEMTMYGWQFCGEQDRITRREDLETLLTVTLKAICESPHFQTSRLVEESCHNKDTFYSCTDLASALIDTGTSWKAIEPMSQWLSIINGFEMSLPVELLLVGMLPVEELWRSIRSFDTLSRGQRAPSTSAESNERAQSWLRQEIEKILPQAADKKYAADRILEAISDYVEQSCQDLSLSSQHGQMPDHGTRLNSFSRLLTTLFAWARGASSDEIQQFAFPKNDKGELVNSFSPRYGERVCWLCLLCLRFFSKTREIRLRPEHEGALQNLAMRMRYGVPSDCIPLMGTGKCQKNRTTVLRYRERFGITLQTVMQYSYDEYDDKRGDLDSLRRKDYTIIRGNAIEYYCRAAIDFCALLTRGSLTESTKASLEKLQTCLQTLRQRKGSYDAEWLADLKMALRGIPRESHFKSSWIGCKLIIRSKRAGDSAWELVIDLLDPLDILYQQKMQNTAKEEEFKRDLNEPGEMKNLRERIAEGMHSPQEYIYAWVPWNSQHDLPAPSLPMFNLMSLVLLLRQLDETRLPAVRRWIQKQKEKGAAHLRIQQLIAEDHLDSSAPEAIEGLRASLPGDILQGVLQMEDPVFPYNN